jgi:hypothetical protein
MKERREKMCFYRKFYCAEVNTMATTRAVILLFIIMMIIDDNDVDDDDDNQLNNTIYIYIVRPPVHFILE